MIKETYQEFGQIYQPGSFPEAELIYGTTIGGQSRLFRACGPLVLEKSYASSGIGHYLADFLAERMGANGEHGWLTTRQCVAVAACILFQAKEHVEGCAGNSHSAVLRESESSGMVDFQLVEHLTEYLKVADMFTGELLFDTADFSMECVMVVARDGIEPPTLQQFHFQRKTPDTRTRPLRRVSLYTGVLFKKREFAGISAGFSFVGAERTAQKTKWRWRQSRANRSPSPIPCYQGLIQGFFMGFAEKALALSVNPHESMRFLGASSR